MSDSFFPYPTGECIKETDSPSLMSSKYRGSNECPSSASGMTYVLFDKEPPNVERSSDPRGVRENKKKSIILFGRTCTFSEVERFDDKLKVWRKIKDLGMHPVPTAHARVQESVSVSMCSIPGKSFFNIV
ncbi:hypothetical protein CEXT_569901 [Caerostris extrusa]|uniref:Uncharacterized protein n=1 Tax=Caerostris extrusa TaxID=172846 RepID=A0AAV4VWF8_CAEEX|nr:hypothetical protein CEXT_569901 [Caerostris extrusa]